MMLGFSGGLGTGGYSPSRTFKHIVTNVTQYSTAATRNIAGRRPCACGKDENSKQAGGTKAHDSKQRHEPGQESLGHDVIEQVIVNGRDKHVTDLKSNHEERDEHQDRCVG